MTQNGRPRRRSEPPSVPTSLHEITRRYVATALALSKAMGLPWTEEFIRQHRESITTCFIQAGMEGLRLPSAVQLPPLAPGAFAPPEPESPSVSAGMADLTGAYAPPEPEPDRDQLPPGEGEASGASTNGEAPTVIPKDSGLPCGGQLIVDLKPAQLAMLVSKTAALMHGEERDRWVSLLGALQSERAARLDRGKRRNGEG